MKTRKYYEIKEVLKLAVKWRKWKGMRENPQTKLFLLNTRKKKIWIKHWLGRKMRKNSRDNHNRGEDNKYDGRGKRRTYLWKLNKVEYQSKEAMLLIPPPMQRGKNYIMGKQHTRKQLKLNSHMCKRYGKKMFVETKSEIARRVLLGDEFTIGRNSSFKRVECHKKFK